jgi:hypothetical protein
MVGGKAEHYEDFFQRIQDVSWEDNPPCWFMCGDGGTIINNRAYGSGNIYSSDSGRDWEKTTDNMNFASQHSAGLYCGIWMRQFFRRDKAPVWVLGGFETYEVLSGGDVLNINRPVIGTSFDGRSVTFQYLGLSQIPGPNLMVNRIEKKGNSAVAEIVHTSSNQFYGNYASMDGVNWTEGSQGSAVDLPATNAPAITDTNQIYQASNSNVAHGKIRKGPYKGRTITIRGSGGDKTYFEPSVELTDSKTGEPLGRSNTGIKYNSSIAYGRYVFVASGQSEEGGAISWTDNGTEWHPTLALSNYRLWALVVGARK